MSRFDVDIKGIQTTLDIQTRFSNEVVNTYDMNHVHLGK